MKYALIKKKLLSNLFNKVFYNLVIKPLNLITSYEYVRERTKLLIMLRSVYEDCLGGMLAFLVMG